MTQSSTTLAEALTDVRRAYRLLWGYQKRVLHIVAEIREQLGFVPHHIEYQFCPPGKRMELSDTWMWDALPFSLIGFESTNGEDPRNVGDRLLYVDVVSDTALKDEKDRSGGGWEPNPARFPAPEVSRSELRVYLVENRKNRRGTIYWHRVKQHAGRTPRDLILSASYCADRRRNPVPIHTLGYKSGSLMP